MKRVIAALLSVLIIFSGGCTTYKNSEPTSTDAVSFTDALGHQIHGSDFKRIVAASGSFAQVWLLAGGQLTGTTQDAFIDNPELSESVSDIGRLHSPSLEAILLLNPDLVILSADISAHVALYNQLSDAGIQAAYFSVETFEEYLDMLKIFTDLTGRSDLYQENGLAVSQQIHEILSRTRSENPPQILLLRASAGKVAARNSSTMAGIMLKDLGCINIADSESDLLDNLSMELILENDPEYIFAVTMGDSQDEVQQALQDILLSDPAWSSLSAVKNNRYILLPKDLFHQKPNQRWGEAYEKLWQILYGA